MIMHHRILFLLCLVFLQSAQMIRAQKIENVDFTVKENVLTVTYDLLNCPPKQLYDLRLLLVDERGKQTPALSVTGDLKKQTQGTHKKIEWQVLLDMSELKGKVSVKVEIVKSYSAKIE